ncbi:putative oxidoreductase YdgJ [Symmachiella macrocystis]|uniref:Putative oxidoreductase YdgJ n=1 Tax=Symmachiella macrocystis TaxID=2527985 RepID=A0A5C6BHY0_9PLAN|nr:Gfo/Idh/MocA family oxidoreductase [Symmachiella macrocystis]TWU11645.1 putative oxidoreductase YdgJ [Symmachiella macrocystis]
MPTTNRRTFLQGSVITGLGTMAMPTSTRAASAADKVTVGLIGCGGRGRYLSGLFANEKNVEVAYLCDVDQDRLARGRREISGKTPQAVNDMRRVLDDKTVDAVIVATPDHWHAPAAILACEAGKHVYVEKPCSHNIREGRLLVDAARRNKRIVQHGTQVRSTDMMIEAVQKLREGIIGDVLVVKAWNIQKRKSIGHGKPSEAPAGLDYDNWVGPAAMVPYQENRVHDGWHWWYDFGTGDMGNDGVHDIDYARWGLGVTTHPSKVTAVGGKYFFDDDQQFPDTQQVTFEYPGDGKPGNRRMFIYEQRLWSTNYPHNVDSGAEFYGTDGQLFLSRRGKIQVLGQRNRRTEVAVAPEPQNAEKHVADFLDSVRNERRPHGDIQHGHLSSSLCHLGNIATRLGRSLEFDPEHETFINDDEANALVSRPYRDHWGAPVGA